MKALERRHRLLQFARIKADARLQALPNVVGTGFGFKTINGKRSQQLCVTVFVRRKVPSERLQRSHHVPASVRRHGLDMPTDVVTIKRIKDQCGFAIHAANQIGTVGAWATDGTAMFGLSCAHCLPAAGEIVTGEFPGPGNYLGFGPSDATISSPGMGIFPAFGDIDAGLIRLTTASVLAYASGQPMQPVYRPQASIDPQDLRTMLNLLPVHGMGATSEVPVNAVVTGVFVSFPPRRFDLMFESPSGDGITKAGDSGLIWTTAGGAAFAIHQAGEEAQGGGASLRAFGSFAFRVADAFGLEIRQG